MLNPSSVVAAFLRSGLWCLTSLSTIFQFISWRSVLLVEETGVPAENFLRFLIDKVDARLTQVTNLLTKYH